MSEIATSPVAEALALLHSPGEVFEVRMIKTGRTKTVSGYFDDCEKAAAAIARYDHKVPGIYTTLNPVNPDLLARAANKLKPYAEITTGDADVLCRRWLLIDVDWHRPAGISATDDEVEAAGKVARSIRSRLTKAGWPGCLLAMSGNGWHLLYRIDLPNDTASRDLVKGVLEKLARKFNADGVEVDTSVFNAARIAKVPGTWVCKGDETPDRPHRLSEVVDRPPELQVVDVDLLRALAGAETPPAKPKNSDYRGNGRGEFDIEEWLARHGLTVRKHKADPGGDLWELDVCPFNAEHILGEPFVRRDISGSLSAGCQHATCFKSWAELRERFEPGYRERQTTAPAAAAPETAAATSSTWPAPLGEAAYHGPIGELVRAWEPHNEADPAAMLATMLVYVGCAMGTRPFYAVGDDHHPARLNAIVVGATSSSRKGMSSGAPNHAMGLVDTAWSKNCRGGGLSSGEGLIEHVRDKVESWVGKGDDRHFEETDPGVTDKRLLVHESEFARTLAVMGRQDNTLSPVLRSLFDTGDARVMTRGQAKLRATGAHVCIVAHITNEELQAKLTDTDTVNGFANRFLWVCSRRQRSLPFGGRAHDTELEPAIEQLSRAVRYASDWPADVGVSPTDDARALWVERYDSLTAGEPGLVGAILARGAPLVMRMALIYALADCRQEIGHEHLQAALEVWRYCSDSVRHLFAGRIGRSDEDRLLEALEQADTMTRTEIRDLYHRHRTTAQVNVMLAQLEAAGRVERVASTPTGGRPLEVWRRCSQ